MPLFRAKIAITNYVDIPVYAESEDEARDYLKTFDDWKEDGAIDDVANLKSDISVDSVELVNNPKDVDFAGDSLCWELASGEETTVGVAYYGDEDTTKFEDDQSVWDEYFIRQNNKADKFNEEACAE
jgi:hypothetical protein